MEITLDLPEGLINKIRAYNILTGGKQPIEPALAGLLDETVSRKIGEAVGLTPDSGMPAVMGQVQPDIQLPPARTAPPPRPVPQDATGIADGLGDEDLNFDDNLDDGLAQTNPEALVPDAGPAEAETDEELFGGDPDLDEGAAAAAPGGTFADDLDAEQAFAVAGGMPAPQALPEEPPVGRQRQRQIRGRARVVPYGG